ncbi:MAG: endonuclease NucS domain-containing protein [Candidatus Hermodarchaeota archaeon]
MFIRDVFRDLKEQDIQKIYFRHPYLIDQKFENCRTEECYSTSSGFADLVLFLNDQITVVELKIEPLKKIHALQVAQYVRELEQEFPDQKVSAILIGRSPKEDLTRLIETFPFSLKIKLLVKDIPIKIKICANCRLASDVNRINCWKCGKSEWLNL